MDDEEEERGSLPVVSEEAWRFGPAKLFYDRLDIPTDPDELDYESVFQPNFDGDGGESPSATAERIRLVESAVGSIICLPEGEGKPERKERLPSPEKSSPRRMKDSPLKPHQIPDDNPETEVAVAVASIMEVISEEDSNDDSLGSEKVPDYYQIQAEAKSSNSLSLRSENVDGQFSLVAQLEWEKDIVWSPDKVHGNISKEKEARAGWIPSITNRSSNRNLEVGDRDKCKSMLSFENQDLITGTWEDDVIWDAEEFRLQYHQPKLPVFDVSNEQFVFNMPEDALPRMESATATTSESVPFALKKKYQCHTMKTKLLLGKTGLFLQPIKTPRQSSQPIAIPIPTPETSSENSKFFRSDFYNISNDQSYQNIKDNVAALKLMRFGDISSRHSKLVRGFTPPFVKINLSKEELRNFHRPQLTNEKNAPVSTDPYNRHFFKSVTKRIQQKALEWAIPLAEDRLALMDLPIDLSGRDGDILLVENCEEFPPLLSQVGMCSNIINYCQRSPSLNDTDIRIPHPYGEKTLVHALPAPYLGRLEEGQIFSSLENNLCCSPIYYHDPCDTDFLVIRNRYNYMIRNINASFTAGQQCPLVEVPEPNSTKARNFLKELLQIFIFRRFRNCTGSKKQVNLEEIIGTFPTLSESNIRNWMKLAADMNKIGSSTWVVMKPDFKLPTEAELEEMVSPEQYCAYASMLAAEQRLKDAGCHSMLSLSELVNWDKEDNRLERKKKKTQRESIGMVIRRDKNYTELEKEMETAPWNTTAAFIAASKGKCFLQIDGPADPTGCGEGFSYVRVPKGGPQQTLKEKMKKLSTCEGTPAPPRPGGTDADLRRLSTEDAKELLRKAGVPKMDVQKLTRWEVIDVVRTLSTEKAKLGDADDGISKFSRWNKTGRLMNQARYKESCQEIFELQNRKLSSAEVLKTDDEDEDENTDRRRWTSEGDIHQFGENIDRILNSDKDKEAQLLHEQEERERVQLQLMMLGKVKAVDAEIVRKEKEKKQAEAALAAEQQKKKKVEMDTLNDILSHPGRVLKIERTYQDDDGRTYTRTELVRDPLVIAVYVKIRTTKNEQFIKDFLKKADAKERKEQKEKDQTTKQLTEKTFSEKKLECWRRKKKREMEPEYFPHRSTTTAKRNPKRKRRKCGKCGLHGHVRTSVECPMFKSNTNKRQKKAKEVYVASSIQNSPLHGSSSDSSVSTQSTSSLQSSDEFSEDGCEVGETGRDNFGNLSKGLPYPKRNLFAEGDKSPNSTQQHEQEKENEEEKGTIVKLDGLKMLLKVPQDMIVKAQMQDEKEKEMSRIFTSMSERIGSDELGANKARRKRMASQAEREHSDYLAGRIFKTTAADRSARKERMTLDELYYS